MRNELHTAYAGHYRLHGLKKALGAVFPIVLVWHERARQRRALAWLDDYLLRDIGLTHADAVRESTKPFWRA